MLPVSPLTPLDEFLAEQGVRLQDLRAALENWVDEAQTTLRHLDEMADPHTYLAGSDHLAAVETFRDLL